MKRPVNVLIRVACLIALGLFAMVPQTALACSYYCGIVDWEPLCFGCIYSEGGSGGCVQTGPCSCYEIQCAAAATETEAREAVSILGFVPVELEPAASPTAD
jgi:hypothetical protein